MFSGLEISRCADFYEHLNKYDVIRFDVQWCCISAGSNENLTYLLRVLQFKQKYGKLFCCLQNRAF